MMEPVYPDSYRMKDPSVTAQDMTAGPGAPVVRIEGFILMGDVTVRDRPSR